MQAKMQGCPLVMIQAFYERLHLIAARPLVNFLTPAVLYQQHQTGVVLLITLQ